MPSCAMCGSLYDLETHHIKPLSRGGEDIPENKVYLCKNCHVQFGKKGFQRQRGKGVNGYGAGVFYLPEPYRSVWQEFRIICVREGTTASKKILHYIVDYVEQHKEGNPQMLMEKFCGEIKKGECFFCHNQNDRLFKVAYVSGLVAPTCQSCLNENKAKKSCSTVKKVLGLMP